MKKTPLWIITAILTAGFLGIMYSFAPAYVCSTYLISAVFLFFMSVYIAMNIHEKENDVFEEVLLLHSKSETGYYLSREILQIRMCLIYSLILAFFPVLKSMLDPQFFTRAVGLKDVLIGGGLIAFSGICGLETGDLFHPRFVERKFAVVYVILICVLTVCKAGLIRTFGAFRILDILTAPVTDSLLLLGNADDFVIPGNILIMLHMLFYSLVFMLLKIRILKSRRYRM